MYIKSQGGKVVQYTGPSLGRSAMTAAGWLWFDGSEPVERIRIEADGAVTIEPDPIVVPIARYSKLKIIRALGNDWPPMRAQLEASGLDDQFFAADYLATDDPVFATYLAGLDDATRALLDNCLWEA